MSAATAPTNELARLAALSEYNVLDTLSENEYDNIVKLASTICDTPIALVSFVDKDRQWFKAKVGLDAKETHRDLAFCAHAILNPTELFIVEDASKDPRFAENPLVTGPPDIRFYAGYPLVNPAGYSLGTLCAIDTKPKKLNKNQVDALRILSTNIATLLELRKSSAEREQLIKKLKDSNDDLENFAFTASHDLKSPLRAISTLTHWLEEDCDDKLPPQSLNHLHTIRKRVKRMNTLLDDLLNYSRVEHDQVESGIICAAKLIEEINEMLNIPTGINIKLDSSFKLFNIPRNPSSQIFQNLISNAVKHHDKEKGNISISVQDDGNFFKFSVSDDGPGIDPKYHAQIFEMFKTLKSSDEVEGSGMGLALVKKIISRIGGQITVESEEGLGTTFHIFYPKEHIEIKGQDVAV